MLSAILGFITSGAGVLIGLLLTLLPTIDLNSLPIMAPPEVTAVLSFVNVFIPTPDLISILTWWAGLILAVNIFFIVKSVFNKVSK